MPFKISDLAGGIALNVEGTPLLLVKKQVPVPNYAEDFSIFELPKPMRLWEVAQRLYNDPQLWSFLADWNSIVRPGRYFIDYLPIRTRMRYLTIEDLLAYQRRQKIYNLSGAGSLEDLGLT